MESTSFELTERQFRDLSDRIERRRVELVVEFERRKRESLSTHKTGLDAEKRRPTRAEEDV